MGSNWLAELQEELESPAPQTNGSKTSKKSIKRKVEAPKNPKTNPVRLVTVDEHLAEVEKSLTAAPIIGADVETYPRDASARSLDPRRGRVSVISLATPAGARFVLDRRVLDPEAILEVFQKGMLGKPLIFHNAPFDLAFLRHSIGYEHDGPVYDTLILDAMLFYATGPLTRDGNWQGFTKRAKEEGYRRSLAEVVGKYLGETLSKEERDEDWGGPLTPAMLEYAARDAEVLLPLREKLISKLEGLGMEKIVDLESRFTPAMAYCSDNGHALDVEGWKEHAAKAREQADAALEECNRLAGDPPEDINGQEWGWSASNHYKIGRALEKLGAKVSKRAETGNYITGEAALRAITEPPAAREMVEALLKYREVEKYVTTWGENWLQDPWLNTKGKVAQNSPRHKLIVDGRVHCQHNQLVVTGRGSSRSPNLQNVPDELRAYFIAPPGRLLVMGDYDQIEYVAAAHLAGDETLLAPLREALKTGGEFDFHTITARMILEEVLEHKPTPTEIKSFRKACKTINFAVLYGMSAKNLATKLTAMGQRGTIAGLKQETTESQAKGYINTLFSRAPALAEWHGEQTRAAKGGVRYATTRLGRRRLVDLYTHKYGNKIVTKANASMVLNHPVQGACAEGYKISAALLWERRNEFAGNPLLVNMVHDELVQETDKEAAEHDAQLQERIMIAGMHEAIGDAPISVGWEIGPVWLKEG